MIGGSTHQRWLLLALTLIALSRGVFWAAALPAPSPIDEMQHFDYVRSLARAEGIPTVGEDVVADEVLHLAKQSPTLFFRSYPYPDDKDAPAWQSARPQYEGIQGPVYYAVLTPFYWLGRPWGVAGSFYLVRVGSALLGALAVPLSWLLARRLAPDRPWLWWLPPLLLATVNAVSAGAAAIGNDIVVVTGTCAAALLLLRGLERRRLRGALAAGASAGLVLVGKSTALALVPLLALLGLPSLIRWWREQRTGALCWVGAYAVAFIAPVAAWLAWNLATYGAISGAEEAEAITGALQESFEPSFETFRGHWFGMRKGFWAGQLNDVLRRYGHLWELITVLGVAAGLTVALRRRLREGWAIAWGAAAYPLTFLAVAGFFLLAFERSGLILGRYGWVALAPVLLALGLSLGLVGGRRAGALLCLVVASIMLHQEVMLTHSFLHKAYERELSDPGLAPVVQQDWNDGYGPAEAIRIDVPCRSSVLDLGLQAPPPSISVETDGGTVRGRLEAAEVAQFARYRLAEPVTGTVEIPVETGVAISVPEREPAGSLVGGRGDPMLRVLCEVDDARAVRFEQLYPPIHPPLSRWMLYAWPVLWLVVSLAATVVALGWSLWSAWTAPRST